MRSIISMTNVQSGAVKTLKEIMKEAYRQLPRCFYMARDATGKINLNDLIEGTNVVMEMDA